MRVSEKEGSRTVGFGAFVVSELFEEVRVGSRAMKPCKQLLCSRFPLTRMCHALREAAGAYLWYSYIFLF